MHGIQQVRVSVYDLVPVTGFDSLPRVPLPCPVDVVVTDGERLATVLAVDDTGRYMLDMDEAEPDEHGRHRLVERCEPILPHHLLGRWRVVRWPDTAPVEEHAA